MKMLINTITDKMEQINALNNAKGFKELKGKTIEILGIMVYSKEKVTEYGEPQSEKITVIKTKDGYYATNSYTITENIETMVMICGQDEIVGKKADVIEQTSKKGRQFLQVVLK